MKLDPKLSEAEENLPRCMNIACVMGLSLSEAQLSQMQRHNNSTKPQPCSAWGLRRRRGRKEVLFLSKWTWWQIWFLDYSPESYPRGQRSRKVLHWVPKSEEDRVPLCWTCEKQEQKNRGRIEGDRYAPLPHPYRACSRETSHHRQSATACLSWMQLVPSLLEQAVSTKYCIAN